LLSFFKQKSSLIIDEAVEAQFSIAPDFSPGFMLRIHQMFNLDQCIIFSCFRRLKSAAIESKLIFIYHPSCPGGEF
jgi:hypothetical protein